MALVLSSTQYSSSTTTHKLVFYLSRKSFPCFPRNATHCAHEEWRCHIYSEKQETRCQRALVEPSSIHHARKSALTARKQACPIELLSFQAHTMTKTWASAIRAPRAGSTRVQPHFARGHDWKLSMSGSSPSSTGENDESTPSGGQPTLQSPLNVEPAWHGRRQNKRRTSFIRVIRDVVYYS
jgi:hypothetical protein